MTPVPRKPAMLLSAKNARGVLLAVSVPKLVGRVVRMQLDSATAGELGGWQSGALRGGGTTMPGFEIRLFLACAGAQARSSAVVFTDIRAAFHRVLPDIALGPILAREQRSMLLIKAGVLETRVADVGRFVVQEDGHLKRQGLTDTRGRRSGRSDVCTCIGYSPAECASTLECWQAAGLCVVSHFRSFWFGCA